MFDTRVMSYKVRQGIALEGTAISVIVQRQIASDVSGVGFSLNPMNNCYDEAVIDASFGLGEAIVSGIVTPDHYMRRQGDDEDPRQTGVRQGGRAASRARRRHHPAPSRPIRRPRH